MERKLSRQRRIHQIRQDRTAFARKILTLRSGPFKRAAAGRPQMQNNGSSAVLFDENTLAGDWREEVIHRRDKGISTDPETLFALAVADLLELPDDMPLVPAVTAAMPVPVRLSDRVSLAHLKAVAHSAGRRALGGVDKALGRAPFGTSLSA